MISYLLKAALFALVLSLPLYPALAYLLDPTPATVPCHTDTECMELNGGDGYDSP